MTWFEWGWIHGFIIGACLVGLVWLRRHKTSRTEEWPSVD
jgi:hypothetical protein